MPIPSLNTGYSFVKEKLIYIESGFANIYSITTIYPLMPGTLVIGIYVTSYRFTCFNLFIHLNYRYKKWKCIAK